MTARRRKLGWLVVAVVTLGAIAGYTLLRGGDRPAQAATRAETVSRHTLRSQIQATGVVRAMTGAEVKVGARVSGRVEHLYANVGARVEKGAPIAKLDDRDLQARVARARADVAATRAQLALVRRGARREEVADSEAAVRQAEAELALARTQEQRTAELASNRYVGQDEADRAGRDLAVAEAKVASARSRLDLTRRRFLPEDVALAAAKLDQAEAVLAETEALASYATITAPIGGIIAQVTTQEGETVTAGLSAPTFVTIIDLDRLEVAAYVDEVDVGRVRVGQKATFTVDAFPDAEFTGTVTSIYPRAVLQSNVVNYITTIAIENSEGRLKPDMTANVNVALDERANVLAVPDRALRREGGRTVVDVVEHGQPRAREVRVGLRGGGLAEIVNGLAEGEQIAIPAPAQSGANK